MAKKKTGRKLARKRVTSREEQNEIRETLKGVLSGRFPPDLIADKIETLLNATEKKFNHKGEEVYEGPNFGAIAKGLDLVLAYTEGLPVKRQETVTIALQGRKELEAHAKKSPAFRRSLAKFNARIAEAADAEVVTDG